MAKKKASDFRYNTGETKVPWAAVGENYNAGDLMSVVEFLMQGSGDAYDAALSAVREKVNALAAISAPPAKLSLDTKVAQAEQAVDEYLGTEASTFVPSCTAGFEIAFRYCNIGPGDEVIVPAITFIATMAYPLAAGAKVVFCDVDPRTLNMNPADLERKITSKTKMIVPVDIGGYPCDLDAIMAIARKHNITVLEDGAHSFGAEYKGRKIGTIADFTGFSLHEVKNITSYGEGGILSTTIDSFRPYIKRCRFFGTTFERQIKDWLYDVELIPGKYAPFVALNASTTEIQAVGLMNQLERVDQIIAERAANAAYLNSRFAENDAIIPQLLGDDEIKPSFHLYQLQIDPAKAGGDIQMLKKKLEARGVTNIPHFGPLYRFDIIRALGYDVDAIAASCPNTEEVFYHRFTHLPVYDLTREQLEYMADAILDAVAEMQAGK
ncbi:MAG: DegT/DnrJ/EryC1/StrS family aminotransferase [Clostridiaceae bacterium]|nr:DegT/DnrJ/EryC1/StrS family aminotransferase [Clostridiaceae bacterium]